MVVLLLLLLLLLLLNLSLFPLSVHLIGSMCSTDFHRQYIDQNSDSGKNNVYLLTHRHETGAAAAAVVAEREAYAACCRRKKKFMRKFESINIKPYIQRIHTA